ncbi:hypothetical protein [Anaerovorax odorimutans]|uniref:hypothetical protein n=1 Tax=Anaerovorax odorimutans TaxID=109327 RepID=UPI00041A628F|nr:hypothetical protein [Anaerovorax odorimutans]
MNNFFVFHGIDHKVGTTMISQSVAEYISNNYDDLKVLFMTLNGRESTEYIKDIPETIEGIKIHIDNKMLRIEDFKRACKITDSLYILAGITNELEKRYYYPDTVSYLLSAVASYFEVIIIDSGNEIDNGLAVGSLSSTDNKFLIITQNESTLKRWERMKPIYNKLEIYFNRFIVNKFDNKDPFSLNYIMQRFELLKPNMLKVERTDYDRQAEMDYKTLLEYRNEKYNHDIEELSNIILTKIGKPIKKKQRKNIWRSFI